MKAFETKVFLYDRLLGNQAASIMGQGGARKKFTSKERKKIVHKIKTGLVKGQWFLPYCEFPFIHPGCSILSVKLRHLANAVRWYTLCKMKAVTHRTM